MEVRGDGLTGVNFPADADDGVAYACPDNGAVLCLVVDNLIHSVLDVVPGGLTPRCWQGRECLEFVAWSTVLASRVCLAPRTRFTHPRTA